MSTIEKAMGKLNRHPSTTTKQSAEVEEVSLPKDSKESHDKNDQPQVIKTDVLPKPAVSSKKKNSNKIIEIDNELLEKSGMISNRTDLKERFIKDEFRVIKHKLLKNAAAVGSDTSQDHNRNLIMVTSANANEGKTFITINLALSIASERDKTVLLIDADVLNPSVADSLGFGEKPGLNDFLLGNVDDIGDIIYPTSIPDFRVMPAGISHDMSYELLSSGRMKALMDELANRYPDRIILLDCPPLVGVVETVTLSNLVGQAAIVVEQNKTKVSDVKQAVSLLNNEIEIGFVINKAVHKAGSGYGYGYGYGYGAKDKKK